jgi:hypothetical protein
MTARSPSSGFTFSAEQLRSAPPEVRRWIATEMAQTIATLGMTSPAGAQLSPPTLTVYTRDEALQIFEAIRGNFLLAQLLFELAREPGVEPTQPGLHPLRVTDVLRHTRISDGDRLMEALSALNTVFRQLRNDPEAALFGFDDYGHVYIHEVTHRSVRQLWEEIMRATPMPVAPHGAPEASMPLFSFSVPALGPSEAVAAHHDGHARAPDYAA